MPQSDALRHIVEERIRQDKKWGEQNHEPAMWLAILGEEFGEACQAALADAFTKNRKQAEKTSGQLRAELVQVAAVAVAFIECLDRNEYRSR